MRGHRCRRCAEKAGALCGAALHQGHRQQTEDVVLRSQMGKDDGLCDALRDALHDRIRSSTHKDNNVTSGFLAAMRLVRFTDDSCVVNVPFVRSDRFFIKLVVSMVVKEQAHDSSAGAHTQC